LIGAKGSLPLISLLDAHIIVPPVNVELGEIPGPLQLVDELCNKWEGVAAFHGHCIEYLIILDQLEGAILLDEETRAAMGDFKGQIPPIQRFKEGVQLVLFLWGQRVHLAHGQGCIQYQLYGMVPASGFREGVKGFLGEHVPEVPKMGQTLTL
jgi:hypothetical protein